MSKVVALIACLAISFCAAANSNPPSPSSGDTATKPENSTTQSKKNTQIGNKTTSIPFARVKILPSAPLQIEASTEEEQRHGYSSPEWWLVYVTIFLALITLGLAIFTARLWRATGGLVSSGEDTARKQLRAYIAIEDIFFYDYILDKTTTPTGISKMFGGKIRTNNLRVTVHNYGATPAHDVEIWRDLSFNSPDGTNYAASIKKPAVGNQMLHPEQSYTATISRNDSPVIPMDRNKSFFVYGRIIYRDIYNRWWKTVYSYAWEPHYGFSPFGDYNRECGPYHNKEKALEE